MTLTSMMLSPEEAKNESPCCAEGDDKGPKYPYGLSINLCDETLAKLGITELPAVGTKMMLHAMVEVTSTSQYERQDEKEININLQITDMELAAEEKKSPESLMYPNSNMK